jgi:hypothetical protein
MPKESSLFLKISRFDKEAAAKAPGYSLADYGKKHPAIENALTSGSFPEGERVPSSGIDLLLILRELSIPLPDSSGGVYLRLLGGDEPRPYAHNA